MALPLEKTLGEVRSDIQIRLGFGMAGQAGIVNSPLIDSFIKSAQDQLYQQFDWLHLRAVDERLTGTGQQFYDYPTDCNIERVSKITVKWGTQVIKMHEGISDGDRAYNIGGPPQKYERRDQIEIWPIPSNNEFTLRTEYIKTLGQLVNNSDRMSLPSAIVFLHALSNAKSHYRQPDAGIYASQLDNTLLKLKQRHRGQTVFRKELVRLGQYDYVDSSSDV